MTAATEPWTWRVRDPGPAEAAQDSAVATSRQAFLVVSQRIPDGLGEGGWWADYLSIDTSGMPAGCFPATRDGYEAITVDGQRGYFHGGLAGCNFSEVIVITGGRAYQLSAYVNLDVPMGSVFDRGLFDTWLATIKFDPGAADDSPPRSPPPG